MSAPGLARNWVMIPHVTQFDEADITELEKFRAHVNEENAKAGVKVSPLAFLMKAVVATLKKYPTVNSSLDGENLIIKQYWNIGFAADTPQGLVVPVIKDVDKKGILDIARETTELAAKARDGQARPERHPGRDVHDLVAGRDRRHRLHPHHQRARGRHPGRLAVGGEAGVERQGVRAAHHAAAVALLRPSRRRRRAGGALHDLSRRR